MKQFKLTFLLTVLMSMVGAKAFAQHFAVDNADGKTIYYGFNGKGGVIVCNNNYTFYYSGVVNIPESVTYNGKTYPVTGIGGSAFYGCSRLTSVTIPNSVTYIGDDAFYYCDKLTSVTIGNSVTSIGVEAFKNCSALTSVIIPNSVTSIGQSAFSGCTGLTSVTIPNSVTRIGERAFYKCSGLTKVIVNDIAAWCNISFSGSLSNPLTYAKHLYSNENTEITNLVIPDEVTRIKDYAFYYCSGLTSVTIPNSVTSIGSSAFYYCSGLTSVTIPNSVTSIGSSVFSGCTGLTSVTIPNSVTSIGESAFYYCSGLTSVTIPNSVTSIGGTAFYYCSGLTSVTIPNSVTSIGESAFYYCSGLTDIYCHIEKPLTIHSDVFYNVHHKNCTLHVPIGRKVLYKAAAVWNDFLYIVEDLPTGILSIDNSQSTIDNDVWFTLNGVRLNGKPTKAGIYIVNGKKVVIK